MSLNKNKLQVTYFITIILVSCLLAESRAADKAEASVNCINKIRACVEAKGAPFSFSEARDACNESSEKVALVKCTCDLMQSKWDSFSDIKRECLSLTRSATEVLLDDVVKDKTYIFWRKDIVKKLAQSKERVICEFRDETPQFRPTGNLLRENGMPANGTYDYAISIYAGDIVIGNSFCEIPNGDSAASCLVERHNAITRAFNVFEFCEK